MDSTESRTETVPTPGTPADADARQPLPILDAPRDGGGDTFCVLPFRHLHLNPSGLPSVCCMYTDGIVQGKGPMSLYRHSLEEVWNSEHLRGVRRKMLAGQRVKGCALCYQEEANGGHSRRVAENGDWEREAAKKGDTLDALKARAAAADYRMASLPSSYYLELSNQCNLKCRMCSGFASSRIERDPVHSRWGGYLPLVPPADTRFAEQKAWHRQEAFLEELLREPGRIEFLNFLGGEPFLIKEVGDILGRLVAAGVARNVVVHITTNGTTTKAPWLDLTEAFRAFHVGVSLDGAGPYLEYIRYPAKWDAVIRNVAALRDWPNVTLCVNATLQIYNMLNIVLLFRALDELGVDFAAHMLHTPEHLSVRAAPPGVRRLAAERLSAYAAADCRPGQRPQVESLAAQVAPEGDGFDAELLRQFMLFTNDLDATRGQSFRQTHAELLALLEEAGFRWTDETLHAGRRPLTLAE